MTERIDVEQEKRREDETHENGISEDTAAGKPGVKKKISDLKNKLKKPTKKQIIIFGIAAAAVAAIAVFIAVKLPSGGKDEVEYENVKVERRDITRTIDGSSILEANDTYDVTALVTGEILTDTFNEGDIVKKDQLLYTIDSEDAQRNVDTSQNNLTKAQQSFADAVKKKNDTIKSNSNNEKTTKNSVAKALDNVSNAQRALDTAGKDVDNLTIRANCSGTVSEVLVKEGDSVTDGTKIASVYDASKLKIQIPFNEADAAGISAGSAAELTIASSGDSLEGYVESVAGATTATQAHAIVRYVTIAVENPGGLSAGEQASASVNGVSCSDLGTFENYDENYVTARVNGRINNLYIDENDHITADQVVGYIESDNVTNSLKNAQTTLSNSRLDLDDAYTKLEQLVIDNDTYSLDSSISSAALALDDARIGLENARKKLEDYEVKAPIDGTIITKNKKAGDKLEQNTGSASDPMAVIYDMSVLTVQLDIDESDIEDIEVGMPVKVTADAAEGVFDGTVTKVGINGTSENGVTTYPVDITIEEYGALLPGMNVDCVIEVESAKDVLAIPVEAVQRGNRVYAKGDKKDENDKAPDGYYSVEVRTGASDSKFIEIKEGVKEGQELLGSIKASGKEAEGADTSTQQQQMGGPGMGGYGGPPMGGGYGGNMGGNRQSGGAGGNRQSGGTR